MFEVQLTPRATDGFARVLERSHHERFESALAGLTATVEGRRLWHINSTPSGGGVAEMLASLLPYLVGAGSDVHWLVVNGDDDFFDVTKRIHNHLHENEGDDVELGHDERVKYDTSLEREGKEIADLVEQGDLVVLHDPQTAGLIPALRDAGTHVLWRCHVGIDEPGPLARGAWDFLRDDVSAADAILFSRPSYVWEGLDADRIAIVAPCIDVLSPKNHPLSDEVTRSILHASGIVRSREDPTSPPEFVRVDDTRGVVSRSARMVETTPIPGDARIVTQVSRWDALKDPVGVLDAFVTKVAPTDERAHLVLAGPETDGVDDDPESAATFKTVQAAWERLSEPGRDQVHLACLPMDDDDENSAMVNALQRRADVVVQKSLAEGFGLTVAEAMWKQRPVVATRVGGIQDQIAHGESGLLIDDPRDFDAFGSAVTGLLQDGDRTRAIGEAARRRVCDHFLPTHHFEHESEVFASVLQ